MTPLPGSRFAVAPHFHLKADWPARLQLGDGVAWRPPTPDELGLLVPDTAGPSPAPEDCVCLFQLPGHLGAAWWTLLDNSAGVLGQGRLIGFDEYASQVAAFLVFKGLPVPAGAHCEVVVGRPTRSGSLAATLWGVIHLGDEDSTYVLSNHDTPGMVRLTLKPGEGIRLPRGGLILDYAPEGRQEPDVLLLISRESTPAT